MAKAVNVAIFIFLIISDCVVTLIAKMERLELTEVPVREVLEVWVVFKELTAAAPGSLLPVPACSLWCHLLACLDMASGCISVVTYRPEKSGPYLRYSKGIQNNCKQGR